MTDRAVASGLYLSSYCLGGLVGAALLGQVFDRLGWPCCVVAIGVSLAFAAALSVFLRGKTPRGSKLLEHERRDRI